MHLWLNRCYSLGASIMQSPPFASTEKLLSPQKVPPLISKLKIQADSPCIHGKRQFRVYRGREGVEAVRSRFNHRERLRRSDDEKGTKSKDLSSISSALPTTRGIRSATSPHPECRAITVSVSSCSFKPSLSTRGFVQQGRAYGRLVFFLRPTVRKRRLKAKSYSTSQGYKIPSSFPSSNIRPQTSIHIYISPSPKPFSKQNFFPRRSILATIMATNGSNGSNGSKYPYPTAYAIEDMFSGTNQHEEAVALLHENVDAQIMGYDHHFAGERKGADSLATTFKEEFSSMVDKDTVKYEVTNVIGGGDSPWAAIEGKATAKSQSGTEHVAIPYTLTSSCFCFDFGLVWLFFTVFHIKKKEKKKKETSLPPI